MQGVIPFSAPNLCGWSYSLCTRATTTVIIDAYWAAPHRLAGAQHTVPLVTMDVTEWSRTHTRHTALGAQMRRVKDFTPRASKTMTTTLLISNRKSDESIKLHPPCTAQRFRSILTFNSYPSTCVIQRSSPEGSLVHASDVTLTTTLHSKHGSLPIKLFRILISFFQRTTALISDKFFFLVFFVLPDELRS